MFQIQVVSIKALFLRSTLQINTSAKTKINLLEMKVNMKVAHMFNKHQTNFKVHSEINFNIYLRWSIFHNL
jgi:hypothetical protein